jgi:hypothetical protein
VAIRNKRAASNYRTMRCFTRFDTLVRPAEAFPRSHVAHSTWIPDGLTVHAGIWFVWEEHSDIEGGNALQADRRIPFSFCSHAENGAWI